MIDHGSTLLQDCDGCGAPGGMLHKDVDVDTHYCPACRRRMTIEENAENHLGTLIDEAAAAWWEHWRAVGLTVDQVDTVVNTWRMALRTAMIDDEERKANALQEKAA